MRHRQLSSLKTLLAGGEGRLADIAREAARRTGLTRRITPHLPADLQPHVQHISVSAAGQATVTVDNAAWATRLRYEQQQLLDALAAEGLRATRIAIKVLPQK